MRRSLQQRRGMHTCNSGIVNHHRRQRRRNIFALRSRSPSLFLPLFPSESLFTLTGLSGRVNVGHGERGGGGGGGGGANWWLQIRLAESATAVFPTHYFLPSFLSLPPQRPKRIMATVKENPLVGRLSVWQDRQTDTAATEGKGRGRRQRGVM